MGKKNLKKNIKSKNTSILQVGLGYTANSSTLRRSFPFQIFKFINKKCNVKIFDEYIRTNSNEVELYKKKFINFKEQPTIKKFDIILIFNNLENKEIFKKLKLNNSLIIDVNSSNKKFFSRYNLNYLSYEI